MTTDIKDRLAVPIEKLRRVCDPEAVRQATPITGVIGQEAAMDAVRRGLEMSAGEYAQRHYNILVVGPPNTGRTSKTLQFTHEFAAELERPAPDMVCLYNFAAPRRPLVLPVPNGKGRRLKKTLDRFAAYAAEKLPAKVTEIRQACEAKAQIETHKEILKASKKIYALGFVIVPQQNEAPAVQIVSILRPGQAMSGDEYQAICEAAKTDPVQADLLEKLGAKERENAPKAQAALVAALKFGHGRMVAAEQEAEQAARQAVSAALDRMLNVLRRLLGDIPAFEAYFVELGKLFAEQAVAESSSEDEAPSGIALLNMAGKKNDRPDPRKLAAVNVLVDNSGSKWPPVVHVTTPQYSNLVGRINWLPAGHDGGMRTDHTMIEAGDLLRANGGYAVIDLNNLMIWGGATTLFKLLKVIRTGRLTIEAQSKFLDVEATADYQTVEIPVNFKIVAICDWQWARVLRSVTEFNSLFRMIAEFDDEMPAEAGPAAYRAFAERCRADGNLPEFSAEAVAKLVEYGQRRVADRTKISTQFGVLKDILTEAAHYASRDGEAVGADHVSQAIRQRFDREALIVRKMLERVDRGQRIFHPDGERVGEINALVVYTLSEDISFGSVIRVSARAYAGSEKVVLVQRECKTSGPSTDQATAIIRGYLSGQYGAEKPPKLAVQICFEQCYGGIDGDSATLAETVCVISALTGLPIDQRLAITGSMDQWGRAQPIGGTNDKIEGHFGALSRRGLLKPGHGVVLPVHNLDDLMLDESVVAAQARGDYQVYAVTCLDEALEIFLGRPAAEIHALVAQKLAAMAAKTPAKASKSAKPDEPANTNKPSEPPPDSK